MTAFLKPAPLLFTLLADDPDRETEAFAEYARTHPDAPGVSRYLPVLGELTRAASAGRGNRAVYDFCEAEAQTQRSLLLDVLGRARAAWAAAHAPHAGSGAETESDPPTLSHGAER